MKEGVFKKYVVEGFTNWFYEMRPYVLRENMSGIYYNKVDNPEKDLGMIVRDPKYPKRTWYISRKHFEENFEPTWRIYCGKEFVFVY